MTTRTKPTNNTAVLRQINTDEWQQMGIRQLLADLCYIPESDPKKDRPHNRLAEMGEYRIAPEMLDLTGMGGEAGFLRAVESLLEQKIAPTFDSVEKTLAYIVNSPEQAHEIVERVRAHRTRTGDIRANAFATAEHLKIGYAAWLFHSVAETEFMGTLGNYEQRFMRAMERIQSIAPVTRRTAATSYDALWEMFREYAREAKKRRDEGKAMGPQYPWRTLNELVRGGFEKGDMHLWTAPTKMGKTTLASAIGRHIAFTQPEFMVVQLHLETNQLTLAQREACTEFWIQPGDIREGLIDPDSEPWKSKIDRAVAQAKQKTGVGFKSRYWYEHCPGLDIAKFEELVVSYKAKAESMGLELVVIMDYYQEMDWTTLPNVQGKTDGLNTLATLLKKHSETYGVYLIVFAQEVDDESDKHGRTSPVGGKWILKRCQAHFRVSRGTDGKDAVAKADMEIVNQKTGDQMVDGLGRPMFWHRVGQPNSQVRIHLCRGNNVNTGSQWLWLANGYFKTLESEPPRDFSE